MKFYAVVHPRSGCFRAADGKLVYNGLSWGMWKDGPRLYTFPTREAAEAHIDSWGKCVAYIRSIHYDTGEQGWEHYCGPITEIEVEVPLAED